MDDAPNELVRKILEKVADPVFLSDNPLVPKKPDDSEKLSNIQPCEDAHAGQTAKEKNIVEKEERKKETDDNETKKKTKESSHEGKEEEQHEKTGEEKNKMKISCRYLKFFCCCVYEKERVVYFY